MVSGGNAAHPVQCDSPLQIAMAVCRTFFWICTCWVKRDSQLQIVMAVWLAAPNGHYFSPEGCHTLPVHSVELFVEGLQGLKTILS